jgi:hypothetical protein
MNFTLHATSVLTLVFLVGGSNLASAHPGHDPYDSIPEKTTSGNKALKATGPVIFSSIQNIEQTSSMEIWAGLRFKAYYHLTITGRRNNNAAEFKRTFTFEVANDTTDRKRIGRGFKPKGAISTRAYVRKISACRNLAEKAMSNPEQYDLRVENRGRKSSACRLINHKRSKERLNPAVKAPARIAKRTVKTHKDSV